MITKVEINSESGYLFRETTGDGVCFVPESCVAFAADGSALIDLIGYVGSGWSVRNRRWSDPAGLGNHALPDPTWPLSSETEPAVVQLHLQRIKQLLRARSAPAR